MNHETVPQVFVVDDDVSVREALSSLIRSAGLTVKTFASASESLRGLEREQPGCLVLDIQLPDINGFELQRRLATDHIQIPIIFLTGHGDIPMSVRAIKAGAVEFLTKPVDDEYLLETIRTAIARGSKREGFGGSASEPSDATGYQTGTISRTVPDQAEIVMSSLRKPGRTANADSEIIGQSPVWRQIMKQIEMVAPTDATVLILGETGT
ncbi:MAG: response regulator, partial [Verrucomicrobia bacterium]|nr:response regulator [Verrucomicrobiota bacterium]